MPRGRPKKDAQTKADTGTGANVGYEAELWRMADALRGSMDAAEYKHVVLGQLIDLVSNIRVGDAESRSKDVMGRVYDPSSGTSGVLDVFAQIVFPWFKTIKLNSEQSGELSARRDTLLPKLVSGELRVKDGERVLERAL